MRARYRVIATGACKTRYKWKRDLPRRIIVGRPRYGFPPRASENPAIQLQFILDWRSRRNAPSNGKKNWCFPLSPDRVIDVRDEIIDISYSQMRNTFFRLRKRRIAIDLWITVFIVRGRQMSNIN